MLLAEATIALMGLLRLVTLLVTLNFRLLIVHSYLLVVGID